MFRINFILIIFVGFVLFQSCSKLDEEFQGDLTEGQVIADSGNTAALLQGVYNTLQFPFTSQLFVFPLMELTTDEAIFPTRGGDWDDNGVWRAFHQHKWLSNNDRLIQVFRALNGVTYAATDLLRYNPKPQEQAEARFLRAWAMYLILDLFDQVPYRDPGESLVQPARIRKGIEALDYIISEINAIKTDLPEAPVGKANKYAAQMLLMKCYLNKAVYTNRASPVFAKTDMDKVISLSDSIINSNRFSFSVNYFDNFAPGNTVLGKENIFTLLNTPGSTPDNFTFFTWGFVLHYNQAPGYFVFNGGATLSDFYAKFEANDLRRGMVYKAPGSPPNPGNRINVGFLIGQQYDYTTDVPLSDRNRNPLIFTPQVKNIELDRNYEVTGIRPLKYFPDYLSFFSPDNDFVIFRFPDVLLMKAEAILRGGAGTVAGMYGSTALEIVNSIRTHTSRTASTLASINLNTLLDERGRELWFESWRRQDMIRFGNFLNPFQEKNYESDPKYLIFPIPDEQLSVNPYLKQNPGY